MVRPDVGRHRALADGRGAGQDGQSRTTRAVRCWVGPAHSPGANSRSRAATCLVPETRGPDGSRRCRSAPSAGLARTLPTPGIEQSRSTTRILPITSFRWPSWSTSEIEAPEFFRRFLTSARSRREAAALSRAAWRCSGVSGGRARALPSVIGRVRGIGRPRSSQQRGLASRHRRHATSAAGLTAPAGCGRRRAPPAAPSPTPAGCPTPRAGPPLVGSRPRSSALRPAGGCCGSYDAGSTPASVERGLQGGRSRVTSSFQSSATSSGALPLRSSKIGSAWISARPVAAADDRPELGLVVLDRVAVALAVAAARRAAAAASSRPRRHRGRHGSSRAARAAGR